jgi:two-component system alkaline phosphatase synthesis response regulator PhoP
MPKKIMIVDDEQALVTLVTELLESNGYTVIAALDGKTCLKKLETVKPALILMDMMMPGMSGTETIEKIRKNPKTKNLKIMFVTVARLSEVGKSNLKKLGVLDYVTKPFDNAALLAKVKKFTASPKKK